MKEWFEIRDFSQGMNRQDAISAGQAPWDLQDALLSERPELRRRGPFTNRYVSLAATHKKNKVLGKTLDASRYQYLTVDAVVAVTTRPSAEVGDDGATYINVIQRGQSPFWLLAHATKEASFADISPAWTDPSTKQDSNPDAVIITTDIGAWVLSFDNTSYTASADGQLTSSEADLKVIAKIDTASGELGGGGFKACATVGSYTFLAGRIAGGTSSKYKKRAPRRIWWSKIQNSETWAETTNANYPARGGSETLPISESIRALAELDGNLVIFTRGQIHVLQVSADPNDWSRQKRASVGTMYPRSVVEYEGTLIFANKEGVFRFDGNQTVNLTEDSIGELYRTKFYQQVLAVDDDESPIEKEVVGIVINDYYIVSLNEDTGDAFCCHLPTNSWVRFSNIPLFAASKGPTEDSRTFGFAPANEYFTGDPENYSISYSRIVRLDRMFVPDAVGQDSIEADDGVVGPTLQLEIRRTSPNDISSDKLWRSVAVLYDAKEGVDEESELTVEYAASPDKDDAIWTEITPLTSTSAMTQVRQAFAATSPAVGLRIREVGKLGKTAIANIELGYKQLRQGRA